MSLQTILARIEKKRMPLVSGKSNAVVSENIKREVHSGKPKDQAIAIAFNKAGRTKKKKKMADFDYA